MRRRQFTVGLVSQLMVALVFLTPFVGMNVYAGEAQDGSETLEEQEGETENQGEPDSYSANEQFLNGNEVNSIIASGTCGEEGDNALWTITDENGRRTLTISGTGEMQDYDAPSNQPWNNYEIDSVVIQNGITQIGNCAFESTALKSVSISQTVLIIGKEAFCSCDGLETIVIPESVTETGQFTFGWCSSLSSITLPNTLEKIGSGAFYGCSSLSEISLPNGLQMLSDRVFEGCTSIKSVTMPSRLSSIGERAFCNCGALTSIKIPEGVETIEKDTFFCCNSLKSIWFPQSIKTISSEAFSNGSSSGFSYGSLTEEVHISDLEGWIRNGLGGGIKGNLFLNDSLITDLVIPEGITRIYEQSFKNRNGFTRISIPNTVTEIDSESFYGCNDLNTVVFEEGFTDVGEKAFFWSGVRKVYLPSSLTHIGERAFDTSERLKEIHIADLESWLNVSCDDEWPSGDLYLNEDSLANVEIPEGITCIKKGPLSFRRNIKSVQIPDSVNTIEAGAFRQCNNLKSINIPEGITAIEESTFSGCFELSDDFQLPDTVKRIERSAFFNCTGFQTFTIPGSVRFIGGSAFRYTYIEKVIFDGPEALWDSITIEDNNEVILNAEIVFTGKPLEGRCGDSVQWDLDADGVLQIRGYGPMYDYSLDSDSNSAPWAEYRDLVTDILIGDGVTHIGSAAFFGCSNLESVSIAESVVSIGKNAFSGCTALSRVGYGGSQDKWSAVTIESGNETLDGAAYTFVNPGDDPGHGEDPGQGEDNENKFKPVSPAIISGETYQFRSGLKDDDSLTYTFDYNDNWVFSDYHNDRYNLLKTSIRVAMAAFGTKEDRGYGEKNIKTMMEKMGFEYTDDSISYPEPTSDSIGAAIGLKNIKSSDGSTKSIILVALRGGGYGKEWAGDFRMGPEENRIYDSKYHQGFRIAADNVELLLGEFLKANKQYISDDLRIWITGFSRAAATSNLVAADLINGYFADDGVDSNEILAFCFECPQDIIDSNAHNEEYFRIINIVNPIDFVPKVPFRNWNFTRYGITYYTPSKETTKSYEKSYKYQMICKYQDLCDYNGISLTDDRVVEVAGQASALDGFLDHISFWISRGAYYKHHEEAFMDLTGTLLGGSGTPDWGAAVPTLLNVLGTSLYTPVRTGMVVGMFKNTNTGPGPSAHFPELCLSWVDSLESFSNYKTKEDSIYRKIFINCPVDAVARDSEGTIVGRIENDEVIEIEDGIVTGIDEDGQKVFILPLDEEYTIDITATEAGEVNCSVTEYNYDNSTTEKVINYKDIEVKEGDILEAKATEVTQQQTVAEYTLQPIESETVIEPDEILTGDNIVSYTLELTVTGNGTVTGGGSYVSGQFAKVNAQANEGADFVGWYDGETLVSKEAEYRFALERDTTLEARFKKQVNKSLELVDISGIETMTYSGESIIQDIAVKDDKTTLIENIDYAVSYENNINAGTAKVTITGIGAYTGSIEKTFEITPKPITPTITLSKASLIYNGKEQRPLITVKDGVTTLTEDDYDVNWSSGCTDVGAYSVTVTLRRNYSGTASESFEIKSPWQKSNGVTYYFDEDGNKVTGWQTIAGEKYYFDKDGAMHIGWLQIGDKWYYFRLTGVMHTGMLKKDGKYYYLEKSGVRHSGWLQVSGKLYYFKVNGEMLTGWLQKSGKMYYFKTNGQMLTGWLQKNGKKFYFRTNGQMLTGWLQVKGKLYYFKENGQMVTGRYKIGNKWFTFDKNGVKQ